MPRDSNGIMTLPTSTWVQTGDTVLPVQHNPPFRDIENALTNSLDRDGRTVMTGPLQMGGNKVTGLGDPSLPGDAMTRRVSGIEFETRALAEAWSGASPMPDSIVIRGDASVDDGLGGTFALGHPSSDTIVVAGESYGRTAIPISALPQSLTSEQKQQARENIGVSNVPPFSLREDAIETRLADCFVLNSGVPNTSQGIAVDEANGWLYLLQETQSQGFISRYELNGHRAQIPESVQNPSPLIAHEGMAVDISGKLWVAARGQNPNVYRGQYVPEGSFVPDQVGGVSLFKFFTDKPSAGGYGAPSVSPDGQLLLVRCAIGEVYYVRGFRLADVSDPGDYTGQELFTFCWAGDFPVQSFSTANDEILVTGGFGMPSAPLLDIRRFGFDGQEKEPPAILDELDMPWAVSDGAGISVISEPEGVCWINKDEGLRPMLLVSNGQFGDRVHRVFGMGFNAKQDAAAFSDDIVASFSTPPSPAHEAAIRDAVFALVSGGLWDRMGALWVFAARAQDQRLVNWIDPRRGALTVYNESGLSIQDKIGITCLGGGTGAWLWSDYTVDKTPNHYRDACHVCAHVLSSGDTRGAVLEAEAGGWTRLYPRDLNNNAKTRLMDSAPENIFPNVTDASGMWVVTRQDRSKYELWRNAELIGTATQDSERVVSVEKRHKIFATATTAQLAWASVGYHLTERNQMNLVSIMNNLRSDIAAL